MKLCEFELYHDAIKGRCTELLAKAFDDVRVRVEYDPSFYAVRVEATVAHRRVRLERGHAFDVYMLNPHDYKHFFRDQLPVEFARDFIDHILRG
jgi:hypothetical protein